MTQGKTYTCGTLTYTRLGLIALFGWLLWGNFCFQIMEAVVPSVLPLKLKALGCSNSLMGLILTTAPGILNMTICPYVSFRSDRYRGRWGRRIPFILGTMPFLAASLILIGMSDDLSVWLQHHAAFLRQMAPATLTIGLIALFLVMFQFFNMFVASVFWYLFNDVVPAPFLARFMGLFGIVSTGAAAAYNYLVFRYAESHMREIFIGAALLYLVGFGLTCLRVKEGKYPPVEGEEHGESRGIRGVLTYFRESFSHKLYWFRFLATGFGAAALAINVFMVFFNREMGLSLDQIGKINAIGSVAMMVVMYGMAIFVDRWHPLRIIVYGAVFSVLGYAVMLVWIFVTLPPVYFFWLNVINVVIGAFLTALINDAGLPCSMRIFPRSRFGQFCSSNAMVRSAFTIVSGVLAGMFVDLVRYFCHGSDVSYRFIYVWSTLFSLANALCLVKVYRLWYGMGGDKNFHPPAPWSPSGVEELPVVPIVGPQSRWLRVSFRLVDGVMAISTLGALALMGWMWRKQYSVAVFWYVWAVVPLSLLAWILWGGLRRVMWRDVEAARAGEGVRSGIPHHGMLMVLGGKFLLVAGIWVFQVVAALHLGMQQGAVAFGVANGVTDILLVLAICWLRWVERGYSCKVDCDG